MKRMILCFLTLLLLPSLAAAGVSGLPARPKFKYVQIDSSPLPVGNDPVQLLINGNGSQIARMRINCGAAAGACASTYLMGNNGLRRWGVRKNQSPEDAVSGLGPNSGSNFEIESFDDSGNHLDAPISIDRKSSDITITQRLLSVRACATGYTRIAPNYCAANGTVTAATITTNACTQTAAIAGLSTATAVKFQVRQNLTARNLVAENVLTTSAYRPTDTTCATSGRGVFFRSFEYVATADGTPIAGGSTPITMETNSSGQTYFQVASGSTGTGWSVVLRVEGYYE